MSKIKKWARRVFNITRWVIDIVIAILGIGTVVGIAIQIGKHYPGYWWVEIVVPVLLAAVFTFFVLRAIYQKPKANK
jgi:cytochrome bd-type quinol oxidase subunit 2